MSDDAPNNGVPLAVLHDAYKESIQARRRWRDLRARFVDPTAQEAAHGDLQSATMYYWECMRGYIANRPGKVANYWERAPLWPDRPVTEAASTCEACDTGFDGEDFTVGDICPVCQEARLTEGEVYVQDDRGELLYEWQQGLKTLEEWNDPTDVEVEVSGTFKRRTKRRERPERLSPEVLFRINRYLDEAANELGLLADMTRYSPTAKVPQE